MSLYLSRRFIGYRKRLDLLFAVNQLLFTLILFDLEELEFFFQLVLQDLFLGHAAGILKFVLLQESLNLPYLLQFLERIL